MSAKPVALDHSVLRTPKVSVTESTTLPPTVSSAVAVYSAGTFVLFVQTCQSFAAGIARAFAGDQLTPAPPASVPFPLVLTTVAPDLSLTVRAREKSEDAVPLFQTSTCGMSSESALGLPAASQLISPVGLEPPTYSPHGAM